MKSIKYFAVFILCCIFYSTAVVHAAVTNSSSSSSSTSKEQNRIRGLKSSKKQASEGRTIVTRGKKKGGSSGGGSSGGGSSSGGGGGGSSGGGSSGGGGNTITPNLIALIEPVGGGSAYGTVTLSFNMDGSFLFALDMGGLISPVGTAAIAQSCSGAIFGNGWNGGTNVYQTLSEGISKSTFRHNNGHSAEENMGKTVVIYDDTGTSNVIGCGTLGMENEEKILVAYMGLLRPASHFHGIDDSFKGTVTVTYHPNVDSFVLEYELRGVFCSESNVLQDQCGIYIYAGTACDGSISFSNPYWNNAIVPNLWTAEGGARYISDGNGMANGYFQMNNGYGYEENYSHAVIIHDHYGRSIAACGLLMEK